MKKFIGSLFGFAVVLAVAGNASAASSIYTDKATFLSVTGADPLAVNDFLDVPVGSTGVPLHYAPGGNIPTYDISTVPGEGVYGLPDGGGLPGGGIGALDVGNAVLQLDILTPGARALGGNFFNTDAGGGFTLASLHFTLSDATTFDFTPTGTSSFVGFVTPDASTFITQVQVVNPAYVPNDPGAAFPSMNHLYVVKNITVVPEPSVVLTNIGVLLSVGAGAVYYRRRIANRA